MMSLTSPVLCAFDAFFIYLLFLDESDSLNDESDELGYDSRSSGTYSFRGFYLRFYESVVGILGSDIFART